MSKTASKNKRTITTEDLAEYQGAHRAESRVRYNGINARIAAMETNVERWLKNNHEDVVAQIEVNRAKLIAIEGSVNMLGKRIDAMRHEQDAMEEARSAPAEEWVPKVGDWVALVNVKYDQIGTVDCRNVGFGRYGVTWGDGRKSGEGSNDLRPATEAEIASHKAKEEQRVKEAEWAKVSELGQFHWTRATKSLIATADAMGAEWHDSDRMENHLGAVTTEDGKLLAQYLSNCAPKDELPEDVFLRLFKGTIAKRAEDERAKKPEGYPYDLMFPYSEVRDFVRMFPVYGPSPLSPEARDRAIEALNESLVVWNDGDDKLVRMYIDQAISALRK